MTTSSPEWSDHVVGGASFPGKVGTVSATWPLAILRLTSEGITVDLRSHLLKRLLHRFVLGDPPSEWWAAAWTELTCVKFGPRSLILEVRGRRACRFVAMTRDRLLPLISHMESRGIPVTSVKSTVGWFAKPT
jgi:hypothetical protein